LTIRMPHENSIISTHEIIPDGCERAARREWLVLDQLVRTGLTLLRLIISLGQTVPGVAGALIASEEVSVG